MARKGPKIEIEADDQKRLVAEIQSWFAENVDEVEVGDLRATLLLEFFVKKLGPLVYNRGIQDAAAHLQEKLVDLEGELFVEVELR